MAPHERENPVIFTDEFITPEYGFHVRGLIDFHLKRLGGMVGLDETYPTDDDAVVRGLYEVALIGAETRESGLAVIEEAALAVAAALLVANFGPTFPVQS